MPTSSRVRPVVRALLAVAMMVIGSLHFIAPSGFVAIVPAWLPSPLLLVYVSGVFEILGGLGLLVPRVRRAAGVGLILLYIAVFPANVNMAIHRIQPDGMHIATWMLYARLPFQLVLIALAWWVSNEPRKPAPRV